MVADTNLLIRTFAAASSALPSFRRRHPAVPPQQRSRPRRTVMVLLGFLLGAILGGFGAFGADYLHRAQREERDVYGDLASLLTSTRRDVMRTLRSVLPGQHRR